jgi:hypothetical protein
MNEIEPRWKEGRQIRAGNARSSSTPAQSSPIKPEDWIRCPDDGSDINRAMITPNNRTLTWVVKCDLIGGVPRVTSLYFRVDADSFPLQPRLSSDLQIAIGSLQKLQTLDIRVYDGELSTALNSLNDLKNLTIYHICMSSSLPFYWLTSWPNLELLRITKDPAAYFYAPGGTDPNTECGIVGEIPASWANRPYLKLRTVDLGHNRLVGRLPDSLINNWKSLREMQLQQNQLSGPIPTGWCNWALDLQQIGTVSFDFSDNNFQVRRQLAFCFQVIFVQAVSIVQFCDC